MQTIRNKTPSTVRADEAERVRPGPGRDLVPLLAGAATAVAACGALFAFTDSDSPLRGPFALFFLLVTPAAAIGAALRGLEPFGRLLTALAGSVVVNMLVAQGMLAVHRWSVRGGLVAVTALSALVLLPVVVRRLRGTGRRHASQVADGKGSVTVKPTKT
ncbi:hypothetical protein M2271_005192 [Streptomyces sp. LBL]|uniref:hypothetical protein n=1 Tax=Streptomyces sp. LBL TaxID=2940562 RepID=UPI0024741A9E|nr:hypothetical protein [Streptomyces sp. LBL]MDH6627368.1 hypothetical protein [Streptomyces sp. LBL]